MRPIAIVTDSSACLPQSLVDQYRIAVVPLTVVIDGQSFRDGAVPAREFYARLKAARHAVTTAAPAPGEFLQAYTSAQDAGAESVLCLTLSSRYSATYASASQAQEIAARDLPGLLVRAADTGGIAMTHGFGVLAAAGALAAGATLEQAAAAAQTVAAAAHLVGVLDTTRYLARGGRIPWIAHWAASLLRIKPVLAASGGKIGLVGRGRTLEGAISAILAYAQKKTEATTPIHAAVMHADATEHANQLAGLVQERLAPAELVLTEITSGMGVHTGPGFVGLALHSGPTPGS